MRNIVLRYGMDPNPGAIVYEEAPSPLLGAMPMATPRKPYSENTAQEIDKAMRDLVRAARLHTMRILTRYRGKPEAGAAQLLARETLLEADLPRIKSTLRPELKAQTAIP